MSVRSDSLMRIADRFKTVLQIGHALYARRVNVKVCDDDNNEYASIDMPYERVDFDPLQTVEGFVEVFQESGASWRARTLAAFWLKLGSLVKNSKEQARKLLEHDDALNLVMTRTKMRVASMNGASLTALARGLQFLQNVNLHNENVWRFDNDVWERISDNVVANVTTLDHLALSGIAGIYADENMYYGYEALFQQVAAEAGFTIDTFSMRSLVAIARAYAKIEHRNLALFFDITRKFVKDINKADPVSLASMAYSCAKAMYKDDELFLAIGRNAIGKLHSFEEHSLCSLAWAFAAANVFSPALFKDSTAFVDRCVQLFLNNKLTVKGMSQLHLWSLWISTEIPEAGGKTFRDARDANNGNRLRDACLVRFKAVSGTGTPSYLQKQVEDALKTLVPTVKREAVLEDIGYSVDALCMTSKGRTIAVDVDGPWHFLRYAEETPNAKTVLKRRLMHQNAREFVSVGYREWDGMQTFQEKRSYLRYKLGLGN